ncbi:ornithine cyclodeaminase [Paractinoplanes deccanensis]|uniref:Ornithine cyclodeaminase n=1 Tax=Paractinoplanes deccanensis TaxID=113561 RepID=A0ABQ3Y2T4_9ACTN|nr:ornithine cyclodeaminase family protein [Actinoplanes deccanensis]GID74290.1 ornithine cyclodeaminase [Actinoplanes deccanensis]
MFNADQVQSLGFARAVAALRGALAAGLDPENEPPRVPIHTGNGEILVMPSADSKTAGVKLVSVAPDNPRRGLPRIHGVYVLFDAETLVPRAVLDGAALTALRTPAVSALGVDLVAPPGARRLVVFGTGPQARGHVEALRAVRPIDSVRVVGRDPARTAAFAAEAGATVADAGAVADADIVACCTTAREPLFPGSLLGPETVVVAVGSHEPGAREVDAETVARCGVLVESRAAALREAGDVLQAIYSGAVTADALVTFADLVRRSGLVQADLVQADLVQADLVQADPVQRSGLVRRSDLVREDVPARPRLIKTVGMGWEDLVIATAVVEAAA